MTSFNSIKYLILLALTAGLIIFSSCNRDDDDNTPENEANVISTVTLTFVDQNNISSVFRAIDPDGDGGNPPVIDEVTLDVMATYRLFLGFLDESDPGNIVDITQEVEEASNAYLVCFDGSGFTSLPQAQDSDDNGDPLGVVSGLTTGSAGSGSLQVILRHEPDKSAAAPCTTGETDVDVTFPVTFQ